MVDNASRRGATNLGMPLMILAFAVVAAFLYWLNGQADAEMAARQAYADSVAAAEAAEELEEMTINPERIQNDASGFVNQEIRLVAVPVASRFGEQGLWLQMPNGNPFLLSLSDSMRAGGVGVEPGDTAEVMGFVRSIAEPVLDAWSDAGTITEGDRLAAEFASHFIDATSVEPAPPGAVPQPEDGAESDPSGGR